MPDSWLAKILKRLQITSKFIKSKKSSGRAGTFRCPDKYQPQLVRALVPAAKPPHIKVGKYLRFYGPSIEQWISQRRRRPVWYGKAVVRRLIRRFCTVRTVGLIPDSGGRVGPLVCFNLFIRRKGMRDHERCVPVVSQLLLGLYLQSFADPHDILTRKLL